MSKSIAWHGALAVVLTLAMPALSSAQTRSTASTAAATTAATREWTVPRTPWGDPDLQGLWPSTRATRGTTR